MGDGQDGPAGRQAVDGLDDLGLAGQVDLAGGLVQEQQGAVGEEGAGERDPLRLPARQPQPVLADDGVQARRHEADLLGQVRPLQGPPHALGGGGRVGQAEVVGDGAREEPGALGDQGASGAHLVLGGGGRGDPAHAHGAGGGQQVAGGQGQEGGLARSRGADEGHVLAARHGQVHVAQHDGAVPVAPAGPITTGTAAAAPGAVGGAAAGGRMGAPSATGPAAAPGAVGAVPVPRPGGGHAAQGQGGGGVVPSPRGRGGGAVVGGGAGGAAGPQDAAHRPLVGQAPHADVEEGADPVQGLEEDEGGQHQGQGVADVDGPGAQPDQGHAGGGGDEEQGEQAVGDEDDELVAGQQPHDGAAVVLPRPAQVGGGARGGAGQGQGGQALDGVEVGPGQARARAARARGGAADLQVQGDDEAGHEDDGHEQDQAGQGVDDDGEEGQDEGRGGEGCGGGGQEGLTVQGDALGAVGQQGDGGARAQIGGAGRSEVEQVRQQAGAQAALLAGGRGAREGLDDDLAGAGHRGREHGLEEEWAPGAGAGRAGAGRAGAGRAGAGGQQGAQAPPQADQRPGLGQGAEDGQREGGGAGPPAADRADGDRGCCRAAAMGACHACLPGCAGCEGNRGADANIIEGSPYLRAR